MKHNNRQKLVQALILTLRVILVISVELQSQPSTHQYIELPKGSKQDKSLCEPPPLLSVLLPTQKVELTWDLGIWKLFGLPNRNYKHVEAKGGRIVSSTQFQWEIAWPTTTPANCIYYIMLAGSSRSLLDGRGVLYRLRTSSLPRREEHHGPARLRRPPLPPRRLPQPGHRLKSASTMSTTTTIALPRNIECRGTQAARGRRRLEGKPSFKEGGLSATWPRLPSVGAWALGNGLGPTHSSTYL